MKEALLGQIDELLRETFEGGLPGQGTAYLDHDSGIRRTLARVNAAQASKRPEGRPSIAAHVRHMAFHLRATSAWIRGDHRPLDWKGSFEPQAVNDVEWAALQQEIEAARAELAGVLHGLEAAKLIEEGAGIGPVAHLAYHLGAIRQHLPA